MTRLGLIAGNGKFPFLVLEAARAQGYEVVVAAIKEEAFPEIESKGAASVHWLSLGELSKLIDTFKAEGVTRAIMAGQVKHKQIFSSIKPDWRLAKLLLSLGTRNTDSLLGAVAKILADEGIMLENSTALLEPLLAKTGVPTKRAPSAQERKNIEYGRAVGRRLAEYDIGQTVVIAEAACVTVEAMEGTDAVIALPTAQIAVMGPEAAINAVFTNQIAAMPEEEREPFRKMMEARYAEDIDIFRLASELIVDTITPFESLRAELIARYSIYQTKEARFSECRNPIYPV